MTNDAMTNECSRPKARGNDVLLDAVLSSSHLTPALSPLRGEGARVMLLIEGKHVAAFELFERVRFVVSRTRQSSHGLQRALIATPSPLNGERAGVRGEDDRTASSSTSLPRASGLEHSLVIAALDFGH